MKKNGKERQVKKLLINRSTVRRLNDRQVGGVMGGAQTRNQSNCVACNCTSTSNPTTG